MVTVGACRRVGVVASEKQRSKSAARQCREKENGRHGGEYEKAPTDEWTSVEIGRDRPRSVESGRRSKAAVGSRCSYTQKDVTARGVARVLYA